MSNLGKWICLVHKLGKLAGAKELFYDRRNRLGIDQVMGHQCLNLLKAHPFPDGTFHSHQSDTVLVLQKFPYGAHPSVTQMVDIIDLALAVLQIDQDLGG